MGKLELTGGALAARYPDKTGAAHQIERRGFT